MNETTRRSVFRTVASGIKEGIVAVFAAGVRRHDPGAVVNAVVAFAGTFAPRFIERRYGVEFRPWQRVYAQIAMFTHAVGMLGPYDDTWWWDHLTHTHSATLLGALVHVGARRTDRDPAPYVLGAVGCGGLLWELMEYVIHETAKRRGLEPILVTYGERDTVLDIAFDLLGALLVIVFGDRLLGNFIRTPEDTAHEE